MFYAQSTSAVISKTNTGSLNNLQYLFWTSFLEANVKVANETIKHSILRTCHCEGRLEIDVGQTAGVHIDFLCPKQESFIKTLWRRKQLSLNCTGNLWKGHAPVPKTSCFYQMQFHWQWHTPKTDMLKVYIYIYTCTLVSLINSPVMHFLPIVTKARYVKPYTIPLFPGFIEGKLIFPSFFSVSGRGLFKTPYIMSTLFTS